MSVSKFIVRCLCFFVLHIASLHSSETFSRSGKECVVLLSNKNYFQKFLTTLHSLTTKGKYRGDICLVIGDDLLGSDLLKHDLLVKNHVIVKHFPDLKFSERFFQITKGLPNIGKLFQYHKLHLFNVYFKRWDTILYIDCGMKIYSNIRPILKIKQPHTLLAHSDAFPQYLWKLEDQFSKNERECYDELCQKFKLDIDYFQTTMLLYDTDIIQEDTFDNLYQLTLEYPISITNDQGIIALYFTNVQPLWKQITLGNEKTFFYDYLKRNKKNKYIMLKG